jgi:hypothetical protein
MTMRKFFGNHFHSIVSHLPVIYRIFNTKTILAEQEERGFGDIRSISEPKYCFGYDTNLETCIEQPQNLSRVSF